MAYELLLLILNIVLFFLSDKIFGFFGKKPNSKSLFIFKLVNFIFIVLISLDLTIDTDNDTFYKLAYSLGVTYFSVLIYELSNKIIIKKLGETRGEKKEETHSSRVMSILSVIFIFLIYILIIIKIWGFDSALETTGIIGILFGFLAFSSSVWAPDLLSGILLLNNNLLNNQDLIILKNEKYIIFKFGFFETVLLNVENNHRTIIKNSILRDNIIDNLNKVASTQGIRETISYNIGYNDSIDYEEYFDILEKIRKKIENKLYSEEEKMLNVNTPLELLIKETGDYAIKITFGYYVKNISDIKTTNQGRIFNSLKSDFNKLALVEFQKQHISLSTPTLINHRKI